MTKGYVIKAKQIVRKDLWDHPTDFFVFGDNMARRGMGGLAREMRDEPNAVGIPTKWAPFRTPSAYFRDHDWQNAEVKCAILEPFHDLKVELEQGHNIVFPADGIGTGMAQLDVTAPDILGRIAGQLKELIAFSEKNAIVASNVPIAYMKIEQLKGAEDGPSKRPPGNARRRVVILGS